MATLLFAALCVGTATAWRNIQTHKARKSSEATTKGAASHSDGPPACYLIVHCMAKRTNIGNIIRSCSAFGVRSVFVAGRKKNTAFYGAKGTKSKVDILFFPSLASVQAHCRGKGIKICGIEIMDDAMPVHAHPFEGPTAFILGNEGTGLSGKEKDVCDFFVYISHYGSGTASLNVTVAGSIVLHHFGLWAGYQERPRHGEKYVVQEAPKHVASVTGEVPPLTEADLKLRNKRQQEAAEQQVIASTQPVVLGSQDACW